MGSSFANKLIGILALLSGLSISAVSVYYSVIGLTAIFSADPIPIRIMAITLEISKLVATIWLKQNWKNSPLSIKIYLLSAILVLMMITSLGVFGFLSKAHADQSLVSGDIQSRISLYDERLSVEKETIETDRKALHQMDEGVNELMNRSNDEHGTERAMSLRKTQQTERNHLLSEINASQKKIASLNEEKAPLAAQSRKVEADVGPIKYIAAFFYGSTDQSILEKAVVWIILILVAVFDPLAVTLLLASQHSFQNLETKLIIETPPKQKKSWRDFSKRITKKEYQEAVQKNNDEMLKRMQSGALPTYDEKLKEGSQIDGSKDNSNHAT